MKWNKILILILIFLFVLHPPIFASKIVGYTNQKCYVYEKASFNSRKKSIPKNTMLYYIATIGKFYKVNIVKYNVNAYIQKKYISKNASSWKNRVQKTRWNLGNTYFKKKDYAYIYSIDKNIYLKIKRLGGTNHFDVEPVTAEDTAKLLQISSGVFSWKRIAMILKIGEHYIACSIVTMPHSSQTIFNNNYDGQFCLHLYGSKTHGSNKVDADHQKQIERAYKWAKG